MPNLNNMTFGEKCEIVDSFADEMKVKLRENLHKGGWREESPVWLLERLQEEVYELWQELKLNSGKGCRQKAISRECADVANFAMMIADVVKLNEGVLIHSLVPEGREESEEG